MLLVIMQGSISSNPETFGLLGILNVGFASQPPTITASSSDPDIWMDDHKSRHVGLSSMLFLRPSKLTMSVGYCFELGNTIHEGQGHFQTGREFELFSGFSQG